MARYLVILVLLASCVSAPPPSPGPSCGVRQPAAIPTGRTGWENFAYFRERPVTDPEMGAMIRYGASLFVNTAYYLGPRGVVGRNLRNHMNCQNCHLEAGTLPYGNNLFSAHGRYPRYRAREGRPLTLAERINSCIEHPHNGKPLAMDSREMLALLAYLQWLSRGQIVDRRRAEDGLSDLAYIARPADPEKGRAVYAESCARCHGNDGEGQMEDDGIAFRYPPVWGPESFSAGSSMHGVLRAAAYIKFNMPYGQAARGQAFLTDEQAYDVAAFIDDDRLHPRPPSPSPGAYPRVEEKPIDYPYPPFADPFSAAQHRLGPFGPIDEYRRRQECRRNG